MKKFAPWNWGSYEETSLFSKWVVFRLEQRSQIFMSRRLLQTKKGPATKYMSGKKKAHYWIALGLLAILMEVRKCLHFTLRGLKSHVASAISHQTSMSFTIRTIKGIERLQTFWGVGISSDDCLTFIDYISTDGSRNWTSGCVPKVDTFFLWLTTFQVISFHAGHQISG